MNKGFYKPTVNPEPKIWVYFKKIDKIFIQEACSDHLRKLFKSD